MVGSMKRTTADAIAFRRLSYGEGALCSLFINPVKEVVFHLRIHTDLSALF
jgi:hypothetical protein